MGDKIDITSAKQEVLNATSANASSWEDIERMRKLIADIRDRLNSANSESEIHEALNALTSIMNDCRSIPEIRNYCGDVLGTIEAVRLHDKTRGQLIQLLDEILKRLEKLLEVLKKQEADNRLREQVRQQLEEAETEKRALQEKMDKLVEKIQMFQEILKRLDD